jgi:hypothetical protein
MDQTVGGVPQLELTDKLYEYFLRLNKHYRVYTCKNKTLFNALNAAEQQEARDASTQLRKIRQNPETVPLWQQFRAQESAYAKEARLFVGEQLDREISGSKYQTVQSVYNLHNKLFQEGKIDSSFSSEEAFRAAIKRRLAAKAAQNPGDH